MSRLLLRARGLASSAAGAVAMLAAAAPLAHATAPTPVTPTITPPGTNELTPIVSWNPSSSGDATGYAVLLDGKVVSRLPATITQVQLNRLEYNGTYTIGVQATNADGARPAPPITYKTAQVDAIAGPLLSSAAPSTASETVTAPVNATASAITSTSATISWGEGTSSSGYVIAYRLTGPGSATAKTAGLNTVTVSTLRPDTDYTLSVIGSTHIPGTTTYVDSPPATVTFHTKAASKAITVPSGVRVDATAFGRVTIAWDPSTGGSGGVAGYRVYDGAQPVYLDESPVDGITVTNRTSATFPVTPGTSRTIVVVAVDAAGNVSAASAPFTVSLPALPDTAPPSDLSLISVLPTAATFTWSASPTPDAHYTFGGQPGNLYAYADTPIATILLRLTPSTRYDVSLKATAPLDNPSTPLTVSFGTPDVEGGTTPTPTPTPTPAPPTFTSTYTVSGSVALKTLTKGSVALAGGTATGTRTGSDFSLAYSVPAASAKLTALGFLPVTAQLSIEPTGPATGSATGDPTAPAIALTSKVRIKLPSVSLLGVKLGGGTNCQASQLSTIALTNVGAFPAPGSGLLSGGTLAGTFSISNLTGCGGLNGVVSSLTAGGGNSLVLALKPAPVA